MADPQVSVIIPTYRREQVLLETIDHLLDLAQPAAEILVIDQTPAHEPATQQALGDHAAAGRIRWVRLPQPSIPHAMNAGLELARHEVALFLDDDIRPEPELVAAHAAAHAANPGTIVAGRVLQPWDEGRPAQQGGPFHFASTEARWVREFIGCNVSMPRRAAIAAGGFDENFVKVAYNFEAEFSHRWLGGGRRIFFEPRACLHHLKTSSGGTRSWGEHLTTWRADHAVGAYYGALRMRRPTVFLTRPVRAVTTRFHLRRPWRIPATLAAEFGGMLWALRLHARGAHLMIAAEGRSP